LSKNSKNFLRKTSIIYQLFVHLLWVYVVGLFVPTEYLGAPIDIIKEHIEETFTDGMTWTNHGEWHIDHIVPICYDNPTFEEQVSRLHYTNPSSIMGN